MSYILCSHNHLTIVLLARVLLAGAWHTYWCHYNQLEECMHDDERDHKISL